MSKKSEQNEQTESNPQELAALKYSRNSWGLLNNVNYHYNEDFSINWEKMIPTKYIALNKDRRAQIESKYSRNFEELQTAIQEGTVDASDIDNSFKLILLAGMKELAKLRGFSKVEYRNNSTSPEYVATECLIKWTPNYETNNLPTIFSSLADAHLGNTKSFATNFLNTIAENRAFVRCVRNYLNIHVVGFDELGGANPIEESQSSTEVSATSPQFPLIRKFEELKSEFKVSWEILRKYLVENKGMDFAGEWASVNDVPKDKAYEVLGIIAEQLEKKRNKKKVE